MPLPQQSRRRASAAPLPTQKASRISLAFNAQLFLDSTGLGRKFSKFRNNETVFTQGDPGTHVMYIREGDVKLSVVNSAGKEAVVEVLGPGDFFGVRCLTGESVYAETATAIAPTTALVIDKSEMVRVIHAEHDFSDRFITNLLSRIARTEEALIDQLFNSSEKRLARALLLLAHYGEPGHPEKVLPKVSQELLAEMVGTTRSRINFFMNKFRKLGFIEYDSEIRINSSLLSVVLHD
jgi:CRP-like cAMP-binding protein